MMHGREKSDSAIVAVKPANKGVSKALVRIRQIVAVDTRGGSRMRESCTYGSERGARGNSHPYRNQPARRMLYA